MSDRLSPPTESWRPQRSGGFPQARPVALAAAALVALLAAGVGGYKLAGRAPRAVPVIEADSRPVRIRPDNPGGMQLAGAEEQFMDGAGPSAEAMAPPPEAPAPEALRAQIKARQSAPEVAPENPPKLAMKAAPPAEAPPAIPVPPLPPALPAPAPAAPPVLAAAAPGRPAAAPAGLSATQVQLAAMDSEGGASAEWQRLSKRAPDLLAQRRPAIQRVEHDGKTLYRLRTGSFADAAQAAAFCTALRAKGAACAIASF